MRKAKKVLLNSSDVCEMLGCSKSYSYKLIKELNDELKKEGYLTISGKISRLYLEKKIYGLSS